MARRFTLVAIIALGLSPAAFAQVTYTLTSSGIPDSFAVGLNASGQMVGYSYSDSASFVWTPTTSSRVNLDLGLYANGINDAGQVVGCYQPDSSSYYSAFVWTNGSLQTLSPLDGHTNSSARAINNSGVVVGSSDDASDVFPVRWSSGSTIAEALSKGDPYVEVYGINATGQMIGYSSNPSRAYSWSSSTNYSILQPLDGHTGTTAIAINASGQIVGQSAGWSSANAVLWDSGSVVPLDLCTIDGGSNSSASAINASGQIVGSVSVHSEGYRGFLYSNGSMKDLNSLLGDVEGWTITGAAGINDLGWIAATAIYEGNSYAVLLTPQGTAIPEPSTYAALLGTGVLGWAAWKRRRRMA